MNRHNILRWLAMAVIVLGVGGFVVGGIVYATTTQSRSAAEPAAPADEPVAAVAVGDEDTDAGIVVGTVDPDGPAAKAGIKRGDIVLEIDDQVIDSPVQFQRHLAELQAGDEVQLKVLHGDDERALTATLEEQNGQPYLGLAPCGAPHDLGSILRGLQGVPGMPATPLIPRVEGVVRGAVIRRVVEDSPAAQAGLLAGDRIIAVGGQELDAEHALVDLISSYPPGSEVTLGIERPGEGSLEVTVVLGEHPEHAGSAYLGVEYAAFAQRGAFRFDVQPFGDQPFVSPPDGGMARGAILLRVVEDSPAEHAGLRQGDTVVAVDGSELDEEHAFADLIKAHMPGDEVTLDIERPDEGSLEVIVVLGEHPEQAGVAYLGVEYSSFPGMPGFELGLPPFGQEGFDARPFGVPPDAEAAQGAIIRSVTEDSPAAAAGLQERDVITAIDSKPIERPQDLVDAITESAPGDTLTLSVYNAESEEEREVVVTLGEDPDNEGRAYLGVAIGGFFRLQRFGGPEGSQGMRPFEEFLERFGDRLPFDLDDGFQFRFDELPLDQFPFEFDPDDFDFNFQLPPGLFKDAPSVPDGSTA